MNEDDRGTPAVRPRLWWLWPTSRLGRWSIGLLVGFLALLWFTQALILHDTGGGSGPADTFFERPVWAVLMIASGALATAAMATGLVAIFRRRERALLVVVATLLGLLVTLFWVGEIFSEH